MQDSFQFSSGQPTPRERSLAEAMEWLTRLQAEPDNAELIKQHLVWLAASAEHQSAWEQARYTWRLLKALPPRDLAMPVSNPSLEDAPVSNTNRDEKVTETAQVIPLPPRRTRMRQWAAVAVAACLLLATLPSLQLWFQADYTTSTGQTRQISLADGSQLYLGADSAVAEDYSAKERRIQLLKGEAYFDVVRDPNRPFVVDTDSLKVTVLGTRFNVVLGKLSESVSVASGKVAVQNLQTGQAEVFAQHLLPGEQLTLAHSGALSLRKLAIEDVGSWRDKRLYVQDVAIADVAATLQRYHGSRIVILGGDLESQRVTGAYDLSEPDQALESVVSPYHGQVHRLPGVLRIVTR